MYLMNAEKKEKKSGVRSAKDCACIAVFVAVLLASQLALSALPGVETVTALFAVYAFCFGYKRGWISATAFSLVRQVLFGFFSSVLVLYLVYYNFFVTVFAWLGKRIKRVARGMLITVPTACVCTAVFTLLDCVITPLFYGFSVRASNAYFYASLSVMFSQIVCAGVSTALLFLPLWRAFVLIKRIIDVGEYRKK